MQVHTHANSEIAAHSLRAKPFRRPTGHSVELGLGARQCNLALGTTQTPDEVATMNMAYACRVLTSLGASGPIAIGVDVHVSWGLLPLIEVGYPLSS